MSRWQLTTEQRVRIVERLMGIVDDKNSKTRDINAAVRNLIAIEQQNLIDEKEQISEVLEYLNAYVANGDHAKPGAVLPAPGDQQGCSGGTQ